MIDITAADAALHRWAREWCQDPMKAHDIAFHMSDWLGDLKALAELLADPDRQTADQAEDIVIGLLIHALPHMAAASKLLLDQPVSDVFGIGAVRCEHDDSLAEPRLSLIVLRSKDPAVTRAFYEAIGLRFQKEQHGGGPEHFAASHGGLVLEVYPATDEQPPSTSVRLGFGVRSVDEAVEAVRALGGKVLRDPHDGQAQERRALVLDPDGRRVELSGPGPR